MLSGVCGDLLSFFLEADTVWVLVGVVCSGLEVEVSRVGVDERVCCRDGVASVGAEDGLFFNFCGVLL